MFRSLVFYFYGIKKGNILCHFPGAVMLLLCLLFLAGVI